MLKDKSNNDDNYDYLLVVCIDNLDRCPHRQIVKVLEAVHLLLEHNKVRSDCAAITLIFVVQVSQLLISLAYRATCRRKRMDGVISAQMKLP